MNLPERVVVVAGASYGIGAATARAMARNGARLARLARTESALENVAEQIRTNGGEATPYAVDLADSGAVGEVSQRVTTELGTPDVVVNNAGAGRWLAVEETAPADVVSAMGGAVLCGILRHAGLSAGHADAGQRALRERHLT